jgi:hypothetical protein
VTRVEEDVPYALDVHPDLHPLRAGHEVRCWRYHDLEGRLLPTADAAAVRSAPA